MTSAALFRGSLTWVLSLPMATPTGTGSTFLAGQDPNSHSFAGGNKNFGAQHLNQADLRFVLDPAFYSVIRFSEHARSLQPCWQSRIGQSHSVPGCVKLSDPHLFKQQRCQMLLFKRGLSLTAWLYVFSWLSL